MEAQAHHGKRFGVRIDWQHRNAELKVLTGTSVEQVRGVAEALAGTMGVVTDVMELQHPEAS
jgi:hypothetical protein